MRHASPREAELNPGTNGSFAAILRQVGAPRAPPGSVPLLAGQQWVMHAIMAILRSWFAPSLAVLTLLLAGCAHNLRKAEPEAAGTAAQQEPRTINSGLSPEEALWHVRAALNVAALLCVRQPGGTELVQRYNTLLVGRKATLTSAYASETRRFGSGDPAAMDRHMTQLYNFFARPEGTVSFCATATTVSQQASTAAAEDLTAFAPTALERLQAAVLSSDVATPATVTTGRARLVQTISPGEWRIQLGAFTGNPAATAAWVEIRKKLPALAAYKPQYEPVPGSPLVRLQIGAASDRTGALQLCAAAAAGGFDCMALARKR